MSTAFFLAANVLPIVCVVCATVLALRSREGWGWMVLLAFITAQVPKHADKTFAAASDLSSPAAPSSEQPKATP